MIINEPLRVLGECCQTVCVLTFICLIIFFAFLEPDQQIYEAEP